MYARHQPLDIAALSYGQLAELARYCRKQLRRGALTHREFCLADAFIWSLHRPRPGGIAVSYTALRQLVHVSREVIAAGLRTLERLRILRRHRREVLVTWHNGGQQRRQAVTVYELLPRNHCESAAATVSNRLQISITCDPPPDAVRAAQMANAQVREARLRALMPALRTRNRPS